MTDSKESQSKRSRNAAELLACFHEKQAQHDENRVEVSAVHGTCFVYHPEGCDRCSKYLEHLLEDISQRPARFSFSKDEILDGIHGAWPHISEYIRDLDISHATLEKELDLEKTDNCRLRSELDTLDERIQELEARLESLQPKPPTGDQSITAASATNIPSSDVGPHPLWSPGDRTYSQKRPDYWSLYMWNAVKEWHTNPMSVPNSLRDDTEGYFLEEDIDVAAWISKVSADISCPAFMEQMKVVFGSLDNFDTAFSGFATNLLKPDHEATMWIMDSSTPLRIGTHIVTGRPPKSQDTKPEKLPTEPDFLALVLEHCALTRAQIYGRIIPYMIRHEAKRPCSRAGSEHAAYMHLTLRPPAHHKGKRPVTGSLQSRISAHAPTPVKTGESSCQQLDEDLDSYNQVREPVLPYEEEPPSGEPETGNTVPPSEGAKVTLTDESHMDILLYQYIHLYALHQ
ncbi:hypothetical protein M422DRAFT_273372 [Sphaerobolus stellatus SS14]|uniref:Uncharacterized protein n=1 Tax=Sphaerobolus stellatus (strain SS14) TaxID=990650 RepID=A0A0C9UJT8_SPHS4|nr:hypothetical protein M422DRAFT_273372 [Sphaerobolus stellatus SS14]